MMSNQGIMKIDTGLTALGFTVIILICIISTFIVLQELLQMERFQTEKKEYKTEGIPAALLSSHSLPNNGLGKERNPLAPLSKTSITGSPTLNSIEHVAVNVRY